MRVVDSEKEDGTFKKALKRTQVMERAVEDTRHSQDNVVGDVLKKLTAIDVQSIPICMSLESKDKEEMVTEEVTVRYI